MRISAIVLAKNEEAVIEECLKSLRWGDEIIVVDDESEDDTVKRAKRYTNKVFVRPLNNDFAGQRNFGLNKAKGEWVFFVDADERVSSELAREIQETVNNTQKNGFYIRRQDFLWGRWLKHGETGNVRLLRLARRGRGEWQRPVHEVWQVAEPVGELKNPLLHYSHTSVAESLKRIDRYSSLNAAHFKKEGTKAYLWQILAFPVGKFIQNFFFRGGFLDGIRGLFMAFLMSFHSFLTRAKLWLLWRRG